MGFNSGFKGLIKVERMQNF